MLSTIKNFDVIPIEPDIEIKELPALKKIRQSNVLSSDIPNALASLIHQAYLYHQVLVLTGDDLWLQILSTFAEHVNEKSEYIEYYRQYLASPDGTKKTITIDVAMFGLGLDYQSWSAENTTKIFDAFLQQVKSQTVTPKIHDLLLNLSTTQPIHYLHSTVALSKMAEKYFEARFIYGCGFRGLKLEITGEDWEKLYTKLRILKEISHPAIREYLSNCHDVFERLKRASSMSTDELKTIYYSENCGSGHQIGYQGWILDIFGPHDESWIPSDAVTSRTSYQFEIFLDDGITKKVSINIGPVGVVAGEDGLRLEYDYYFEDPVSLDWTFDGVKICQKDVIWTPENYFKIRYGGKLFHELNFDVPFHKLIGTGVRKGLYSNEQEPFIVFIDKEESLHFCRTNGNFHQGEYKVYGWASLGEKIIGSTKSSLQKKGVLHFF